MKLSRVRGRLAAVVLGLVFCIASRGESQVVINEVIADNADTPPKDIGGGTPDMVELYNLGDEPVVLGAATAAASYHLSDGCRSGSDPFDADDCEFPTGSNEDDDGDVDGAWRFPQGTVIAPKGHLVVFCDGSASEALCELHASFGITSNGEESIVLWTPENARGERAVADRVWLPPLKTDVAFARRTDGAGGANVPLEDILNHFVFSPREGGTFGECRELSTDCNLGKKRECLGAPNDGKRGAFSPDIRLSDYSTNHPGAEEPVRLTVEVRDDRRPLPDNIVGVEIVYSIDGVGPAVVNMAFREERIEPGRPLAYFSLWDGEIPPAPAGSIVEFTLVVRDVDRTDDGEDPDELCSNMDTADHCRDIGIPASECPEVVVGPCNELGLPGTDCLPDDRDPERRFEDCNAPYRYRVAHDPGPDLRRLVINEIVPLQTRIIKDTTDNNFEDYIELYNGSDVEIDLGGLWLSDRPFEPQGTPFPEGAKIAPGGYVMVWLDDDGYRCPRPADYDDTDPQEPQKCPDPTNPGVNRYHTNFRLSADGEQIYLFDRLENGLGLIHGLEFGPQDSDKAFALCPNGDPNGRFVVQDGTPLMANSCAVEITFRRGDANGDCTVGITDPVFHLANLFQGGPEPPCKDAADANDDGELGISDPVFVLNFLFAGGAKPNAPGPEVSGPDPTQDALGCATPSRCQ